MPADYNSAAKALALPISPLASPSPEREATRPPWSRLSSSTRRNNTSPYSSQQTPQSYKDRLLRRADKIQRKVISTFLKLSMLQRILAIVALVVAFVFGILVLVYSEKIWAILAPVAQKWRDLKGGWMILWSLTFISAFPPLIGYSTTVSIAGFVYGFPNGWYIVASSTIVGSLASFLASRTVLSNYVHRLVGEDKRFEALALTLKHDGLKILCMIRFCPLPYSLSNAAMSTFPTVHPLMFALATAIASPKLLIHVFIGDRLARIAESGGEMDTSTRIINYTSIAIGAILGIGVGWWIYSQTIARAKELELEEEAARREAGGIAGRDYTDGEADSAALMNDDDISLWDNYDGQGYSDDFTDEDDDVFAHGDADEESAIGGAGTKKTQT